MRQKRCGLLHYRGFVTTSEPGSTPDEHERTWQSLLDDLESRRAAAAAMGGDVRLGKRAAEGRLDVRRRIGLLIDDGSFTEIGGLGGDGPSTGIVTGIGRVGGRSVAVGAEDFSVAGGSIGGGESAKRQRIAELALQERIPLVMLQDGVGHRPPDPSASVAPPVPPAT
jgi:acetyl-CoA carboxylase carboxyltransferase component